MPFRLSDLLPRLLRRGAPDAPDANNRTRALVTGTVAVGALVTGAVMERTRRLRLPPASTLAPALEADVAELAIMEGTTRYYHRPGAGVPIVLLHSINAAASSFEMKPIFDHLAATTGRPLYALEWFGFGLSDRPAARYRPGLYQRQLRRVLGEHLRQPADVVTLSLASEFAAIVATAFPRLIRRLVCIAPTALGRSQESTLVQRGLIGAADTVGAFEVFFARLTTREALRRFYAQRVFAPDAPVPEALVDYAFATAHVQGAHHAPRWFVQGTLFMNALARQAYERLHVPTLFLIPTRAASSLQEFDRAPEVQARNAAFIRLQTLPTGLLPQWEAPEVLLAAIDEALAETAPAHS